MKIRNLFLPLVALCVLCFSSCREDGPTYSRVALKNTELMSVLKSKGFVFSADGKLELNDLAVVTTALDLSGTKLTDFSGLDILPNLKEVKLADNGYGFTFDLGKLPAQITGVDLTGNEIYYFEGLVDVKTEENGDLTVTPLRDITKLYLPKTAKDNTEELVYFYQNKKEAIAGGKVDMKMEDGKGSLQPYGTLRNVPDEHLRQYLKDTFSDLFSGDQIDLSKRLGLEQQNAWIYIEESVGVEDFEGIQYIVKHPSWVSGAIGLLGAKSDTNVPPLKVGKGIDRLQLYNVKIGQLDLSNAKSLISVSLEKVTGLSILDMSQTLFGQRDLITEAQEWTGSFMTLINCSSLKEIILPDKPELKIAGINIDRLDALEKFDMSRLSMVPRLSIGNLPERVNLVYPELTMFYEEETEQEEATTDFACSESTFNMASTKAFIDRYYTNKNPKRLRHWARLYSPYDDTPDYDWIKAVTDKK